MRRVLALVIVLAVAAGLAVVSSGTAMAKSGGKPDAKFKTARAHLHELNESDITATIRFIDTGSQLRVVGTAQGLDPDEVYVSLIYDNGSVDTGPTACAPTSQALTGVQMFVGVWVVDEHGQGTLATIKSHEGNSTRTPAEVQKLFGDLSTGNSYTPIGTFRTVSVRGSENNFDPPLACGVVKSK